MRSKMRSRLALLVVAALLSIGVSVSVPAHHASANGSGGCCEQITILNDGATGYPYTADSVSVTGLNQNGVTVTKNYWLNNRSAGYGQYTYLTGDWWQSYNYVSIYVYYCLSNGCYSDQYLYNFVDNCSTNWVYMDTEGTFDHC